MSALLPFHLLTAIACLTPLLFSNWLDDQSGLPKAVAIQLGTLLLWLVMLWRRDRVRLVWPRLFWPLLALLIWAALSLGWATNRYEAGLRLWHWTLCLALALAAVRLLDSEENRDRLCCCLVGTGCLLSLLGIVQHLLPGVIGFIPQTVPPAATLANKNFASHIVVALLPLGLCFGVTAAGTRRRWLFAAAVAAMTLYLFYAGTKSAWLALLAELLLLGAAALICRRQVDWRVLLPPVAAALLCVLLLMNVSSNGFTWFFRGQLANVIASVQTPADDAPSAEANADAEAEAEAPAANQNSAYEGSVGIRLAVWRNALEMIRDRPLHGVGIGNFIVAYPPYSRRAAKEEILGERFKVFNAHNDYIQCAVELGLIGFLLAMAFLAALLVTLLSVARANDGDRVLAVALLAGTLGLMVVGAFSFPAQRPVPPMLLAVFAATAASLRAGAQDRRLTLGGRQRQLAAVAAAAILLVAGIHSWRQVLADHYYKALRIAMGGRRWDAAVAAGTAAARWQPSRLVVWYLVGGAHYEAGRPQQAVDAFAKVLAGYPHFADILTAQGRALRAVGQAAAANQAFSRAIEIMPHYARAYVGRALVQSAAGDHAGALTDLRRACELAPQVAAYQLELGLAAVAAGERDEASSAFTRATQIGRPAIAAAKAWNELGKLASARADLAAAGDAFAQAAALAPERPRYLYNLGVVALQSGDKAAARQAFEGALAISDDSDQAHKALGLVLYDSPETRAAAIAHFRRALELNPNLDGAAELRAAIAKHGKAP